MSRVVKALDRIEGSDLFLDEEDGAVRLPVVPQEPAKAVVPPQEGQAVQVSYAKTRVANACFHTMEERRLLGNTAPQGLKDAFNIIRTRILHQTREHKLNTIMVTSPERGEGKTTIATNLAITLARDARQTALLVDANLRWPGISCSLGMDHHEGLVDHLARNVPLETLFVNPGIDKLVVLTAGASQDDSADILSSPRMQNLVRELKGRYADRYVIFDCPHLLDFPDALVFAEYVDGIILVASDAETSRGSLNAALEMLQGRNVLGIVLNKVR